MNNSNPFKNFKSDIPASIVVFFLAIPLCLGIALASGAQLFSGLIAGILGCVVVGTLSGSPTGVSSPAAGLATIVLTAIGTLGSFENFILAVILGGVIQLIFGILKAGVISYYFPSSVIKGMLTGIGIIIILKQIPHFFGYNSALEGDFAFFHLDGENTFSKIINSLNFISPIATLIAFMAMFILLLWSNVLTIKDKIFQHIQGPLVAFAGGIVYFSITQGNATWAISSDLLVRLPVPKDAYSFFDQFSFPNYAAICNPQVWITAFTIVLVAFLNKCAVLKELDSLPLESYLELDVRKTRYLDNDIIEILEDFSEKARNRKININLISERGIQENPDSFIQFFQLTPKTT